MVRAASDEAARHKLFNALERALAAEELDPGLGEDAARLTAIPGSVEDLSWQNNPLWQAWLNNSRKFHVLHGAANLSFREEDRCQVWRANVDGTRSLLQILGPLMQTISFNYVSTAYVAGTREGVILVVVYPRATGLIAIWVLISSTRT